VWPYVLRRLAWMGVVLVGVSLLTFILTYGVPTNPAQMVAGPQASVDTIQRIHHELGLDRSLPEQYGLHALALLRGDLGHSWRLQRPVSELVAERIPATLLLALAGVLVELLIGLPIGLVSAVYQGSRLDRWLMTGSFLCLAAPPFWLGLVLLYTFGFLLPLLPLGGYGTLRHLGLPALTIGLAFSPWYARILRSSLLEVLDADFIRTARAKGLPGPLILFRHAMPNAVRPVLTLMGNDLAHYLGGIIVVEQVFGWPGIGSLALEAILNVDIPVIMAVVFLSGVIVAVVNLLVDLAYGLLDPRVSYQ
jgi:peptide/nickel transport system permease protein